ncbi:MULTISPECIES: DUF2252 domain-containing protein [unclassified Duganella]|uniref:DUF2252 domain-containing protein n=1 Tax=unclassified Duganella TaxID=2636909 RepID=UPI000E34A296|nr:MULTISPECIES: DUF2252 family protein [unclassified Duganella]RFP08046.1 DUF2252 domain-containing protein [Duganella sp. BJB475]RFP23851.1 DUF2252 domain-containing protein [Duganella sp. BJB476]
MNTDALVAALQAHNQDRDPQLLRMKYQKMAQSAFLFLRGADHLFYDALPDQPLFRSAPLAWACGDLHVENFGSYKGDNRQVYFDLNDFDEGALAPASWDLVRLLASIQCGADALRVSAPEAEDLGAHCLDAYRAALAGGKPRWVERETSVGLIQDLLCDLKNRKRVDFLDKRTTRKGQRRSLNLDGVKALPLLPGQHELLAEFLPRFAQQQDNPGFYTMLDAARRIAGTGSLGLMRFVVLVEGKGSPDGNYLLDIKECKPSALAPRLAAWKIKQPAWPDQASRVVAVQQRMQAVDHAFLHAIPLDGKSCVLRGLQPSEDRVALDAWGKRLSRLQEVIATMGCNLAWDQLRAAGRSGAAGADELIAHGHDDGWRQPMLDAAIAMTKLTQSQWQASKAWLASA